MLSKTTWDHMKGVMKMNEELINIKIKYYMETLQVPDFEDWVDYWKHWATEDGATTEKLSSLAKDAFDHHLKHSEINKKLTLQLPPFNNNVSEEEVAAWNFTLRVIYSKYVYDLPNYLPSRDNTALELIRGKKVNMRKFYNEIAWVLEDARVLLPITVGSKDRIQEMYNELESNS